MTVLDHSGEIPKPAGGDGAPCPQDPPAIAAYRCRPADDCVFERIGEGIAGIAGWAPHELAGAEQGLRGRVHPDDWPGRQAAVAAAERAGRPYSMRYRIRHRDGSVRRVLDQGQALAGADGRPEAQAGFLTAISTLDPDREALERIERALRASRERLSLAQRAGRLGVFDWDRVAGKVVWTPEAEAIHGLAPGTFGGRYEDWARLLEPEDELAVSAQLVAAMRERDAQTRFEYRFRCPKTGELRWIEARVGLSYGADDTCVRAVGTHLDITERKRTEERLRQREREVRTLAESSPDIVGRLDRELRYLFVNRAVAAAMGPTPEEHLGKTNDELGYPPGLCALWSAFFRDIFRSGEPGELDFSFPSPTGLKHFSMRAVPEVGPEGDIETVMFTTRDLTRLKETETALKDARRRLLAALAGAEIATWVWELAEGRMHTDRNMGAYYGVRDPGEGLSLEAYAQTLHPEDRERVLASLAAAAERGEDFVAEYRLARFDPPRWVYARGAAEWDADGERPERYAGVFMDVSERKRAEQALARSEATFRRLADANLVGVGVGSADGRIEYVNDEMLRMMGVSREDLDSGRVDWAKAIAPEDRAGLAVSAEELAREGKSLGYQRSFLRPDGGRTPFVGAAALIAPDADTHVSIALDLTPIRAAEAALRESEARLRQLADGMPQLVWTAEPDGTVDYFNGRAGEYAGIGHTPDAGLGWQPILHPDDREPTVAAWQQSVATGELYQCEHRLRMADGGIRWHLSRAIPLHDGAGRVVKWFGTATDIEDLKRAQAELQAADRRKDELIATLAHELRNPLAPIRHAAEIFRLRAPPDPPLARAQEMLERQLAHLVRLVDDLLDVGRITSGKLRLRSERIELRALLEQTLETARAQHPGGRPEMTAVLPAAPLVLEGDPVRLTQIVLNLLNNAGRHTPPEGRIELSAGRAGETAVVRVADTGVGIAAEDLPRLFGMFTQLGVPGVDGGGLGIGLALARALAEMHGGRLEAASPGLGQGSVFTLTLPLAGAARAEAEAGGQAESAPVSREIPGGDGPAAPAPPVAAPAPPVAGPAPPVAGPAPPVAGPAPPVAGPALPVASPAAAEGALDPRESGGDPAEGPGAASAPHILLADDNPDVADSLAMLLDLFGYRVTVVRDGQEAVEAAERLRPNAVLLDIGMPRLDGHAACREIRSRPWGARIPAVALTGWGQDGDRRRSDEAGFDRHLVKPVEPAALLAVLAELCPPPH